MFVFVKHASLRGMTKAAQSFSSLFPEAKALRFLLLLFGIVQTQGFGAGAARVFGWSRSRHFGPALS